MCAPLGAYVTLAPIMQLEGGNNKQQVLEKQWSLQTCQPVCMLSSKYTLSLLTTQKPGDASVHVQDCKQATAEDEFDQSEHLSRFAFKSFLCVLFLFQTGSVCVCA